MLVLERRAERSTAAMIVSPLIAIALTLVTMAILFTLLGHNPFKALAVYFIEPLTDAYGLQEIVVKATPLVLIAVGLSLCYVANVWNIGAEGQFLIGTVCGSWLAVKTNGTDAGMWVLPAMLVLGAVGGALYALIPALCRVKFGASEILTSLMLVYVADLLLDYLTRVFQGLLLFYVLACDCSIISRAGLGAIPRATTSRRRRSSIRLRPCRY